MAMNIKTYPCSGRRARGVEPCFATSISVRFERSETLGKATKLEVLCE
jgi:hypothetical protein